MDPVLNPGVFVFASVKPGVAIEPEFILASIKEPEGLSVVMNEADAQHRNLEPLFRCAWITLSLNSDLHSVGLTAAFAAALASAGISCNVIAGAYHDHIFVPAQMAEQAMRELHSLQARASIR
ncbi:MAG TPA: ACT domain-containing protein [Bryobacteraceae bacterium]|nr:ACT domain-containing protein [Bryobacteraceae bacterium]